jgi:hypothetical protein
VLTRIPFGEWAPDLAPVQGGVERCVNVLPMPNGYRPVESFAAITVALPERFAGGGAFLSSSGVAHLLAGTANRLTRYDAGAWASKVSGLSVTRWRFGQFGNNIVAVNGGAPIKYDLTTATASNLGGSPPNASLVAIVRDFVVLAGDPADRLTVRWSGFNNSEQWAIGTNQADSQPMLSGGPITGLTGGEYGLILQPDRIVRMTYTGGEAIFQFDEIASNIGCMVSGSVAQAGQMVFFLSERGFMVCNGTSVQPIGKEKIDRTFFARHSRTDIIAGIMSAVDPRQTLVMWAMPGDPGVVWCYDWTLERWSTIEVANNGLFTGFTANVSLEGIDTLYPDGIDSVPYSLDAPRFNAGNARILPVSSANVIGAFGGPNMPAMVQSCDQELAPGRTVRARFCRALSDDVSGTVSLDMRRRAGDPEKVTASAAIRPSGNVPIRATGRHVQATHIVPAGAVWGYTQGIEVEGDQAGRR